ncbi:hypothetical protein ACB094_11G025100 [Castanea mollissima]
MFTFDNKGTLKIVPQGGDPVVLYSSPRPTENTVATLLDSGNFILKEMHSNGSMKQVLWQSFDYPGDTLLPGMKLGFSHKTGQTWSLTSWLTDEIPVPGPCKLEWDPKGCQLIIRQRGEVYWTSGVLKRGNRFRSISLDVTSMYNFIVVSNEDEEYFSFSNRNQSLMSEWLLTPMGQLKDLKGLDIARADNCYGYNTNGGCQRWKQPECRHHGDTFDLISGYIVAGDLSVNYNSSLSISDCRAICWKNCGCAAFTSWFHNDTGCRFWTGNWSFLSGHPSALPSIFVLSSNPSQSDILYWIDQNRSKLLDWKKRFNIIEGIIQGLIYLHKYSRLRVIHRDLKASNILLDESMNPKISDFGMARMFKQNEPVANTNRIVGTYGYMSPEYAMNGVFSIKSDVYSFGVLMLEMVSG